MIQKNLLFFIYLFIFLNDDEEMISFSLLSFLKYDEILLRQEYSAQHAY